MSALPPKRERFCREYLIDLNGAAAARRAGYSERSAASTAYELLREPDVEARIVELKAERAARTNVTADRVLEELARVGFFRITEAVEWDEERAAFVPSAHLSEDDAAAISSIQAETRTDPDGSRRVRVRVRAHDKIAALREMAKHLGIADRIDLTSGGGALTIYLPSNERDDLPDAVADRLEPGKPSTNGSG